MRFKRMIAALLSAAIYMTAGAAAAELPQDAAETETTAVTTETAAERDLTQMCRQRRAVVSAAKDHARVSAQRQGGDQSAGVLN